MQLKQTILLLINPLGNKKRIGKITKQISEDLSKKKIIFKSFIELWPDDVNAYKEIWLIGGDGTLNYFINFYIAYRTV